MSQDQSAATAIEELQSVYNFLDNELNNGNDKPRAREFISERINALKKSGVKYIRTDTTAEVEVRVSAKFDFRSGVVDEIEFEFPEHFPDEMVQFMLNHVINHIEIEKGRRELEPDSPVKKTRRKSSIILEP